MTSWRCQEYINMGFLDPLITQMTRNEPEDRPIAKDALELFNDLLLTERQAEKDWRLIRREEFPIGRILRDARFALSQLARVPSL